MATKSGEYMVPKRSAGPGETGPIMVQVYAMTDVGLTRDHNEDAFLVANLSGGEPLHFDRLIEQKADAKGTLFMVADGMGGAAAGEIASATAVDVVLRHLRDQLSARGSTSPEEFVTAVSRAAEVANWSIFRYAAGHPDLRGMGTTATIVSLLGDTLYLAQVGDSRAYLLREGEAIQLTKDQSLMQKLIEAGELTEEEAEHSERRNIILQALGPEPALKLDLTQQRVRRGDILVLCSDGLSGLVKADEFVRAFDEEVDLAAACERLVALANDRGGPDNVTVVAARFEGEGLEPPKPNDNIGHQPFSLGTEGTSTTESTPVAVPASRRGEQVPPPPFEALLVDENRRRQGERYIRVITLIGAALVIYLAWKWLA
jgi:PPM family protein phosphatase